MQSKPSTDTISWLRLIRSDQVGPITFWQLLHRYGSAKQAIDALSNHIRQGNQKFRLFSQQEAEQEIKFHKKQGFNLIPAFDPSFPQILKAIPDCPPFLSIYGQVNILNQPTLGIVGARNASLNGRLFAERLAVGLSKGGWKIASGLARGIDRYAHQGALESGTIAVIAGGIDTIYPPEHKDLYQDIAKAGAIVSEMPLGLFPGASHFPRRNRIISGLSKGIIVIEAALKSGSLITARNALEQGRELFAVPGSPLDPRCRGTNNLIRQGAYLVESAEDILNVLGFPSQGSTQEEEPISTPIISIDWNVLEIEIFNDLSPTPISVDAIIDRHQVPPQTILTLIMEWELQGRVQRYPGNMVSRVI